MPSKLAPSGASVDDLVAQHSQPQSLKVPRQSSRSLRAHPSQQKRPPLAAGRKVEPPQQQPQNGTEATKGSDRHVLKEFAHYSNTPPTTKHTPNGVSSHRHFFSTYEIVEREQHQRASLDIEEDRERWRLHRHHLKWNVTTPPKAPRQQLRATQFQSYMTPRYYGDGADTNSSSDMGREPSQQSINHNLSGLTISPKAKPYVTPSLYPRTTTQVSPTPVAGVTMSPKDIQRSQRGGRRPFAHSTNFLDTAQETASLSVCNMALGKLVVHRQGDVEPQALVDGHKETCWMSRPAKHQWVYVDLESVQDCTTLRLLFDDRYYATSFRIEVSTNAQDWVCVRDRRNLKAPSNVGNRFWAEINLCNARGRYVRIWPTLTNNEQDCMKLHCLEVLVAVPEPETIPGGSLGSDDDEEEGGVHTVGHIP